MQECRTSGASGRCPGMGIPTSIGSRLPEVSYQCRIMLGEGRGSSRRRRITRLASKGKGETRRLQPFFMGRHHR
jgi:hypothetical protein